MHGSGRAWHSRFSASRSGCHLLASFRQVRCHLSLPALWLRAKERSFNFSIDYMFKSTSTQSSSTVASPPGSTTDATGEPRGNHADALAKQESAQRKVEVQLAKFELAQMKNIELIKQIARAHEQKELHQANLNLHADHLSEIRSEANALTINLTNENIKELQIPSKNSIPTESGKINPILLANLISNDPALIQLGSRLCTEERNSYEERKKIADIHSTIDTLFKNKESTEADVNESRMELTQAMKALSTVKSGAFNAADIDHLLCIAVQKMAAADASIARLSLNQAQKNFNQAQFFLENSSSKLNEISKQMDFKYNQLNAAQDEFLKSDNYPKNNPDIKKYQADFLSIPEHKLIYGSLSNLVKQHQNEDFSHSISKASHALANRDLIEAKTKFQKTENILKESDCALARAKLALNQQIPDSDPANLIDDAISTDSMPISASDHSEAPKESPLEEQVACIGTPPTFDAL